MLLRILAALCITTAVLLEGCGGGSTKAAVEPTVGVAEAGLSRTPEPSRKPTQESLRQSWAERDARERANDWTAIYAHEGNYFRAQCSLSDVSTFYQKVKDTFGDSYLQATTVLTDIEVSGNIATFTSSRELNGVQVSAPSSSRDVFIEGDWHDGGIPSYCTAKSPDTTTPAAPTISFEATARSPIPTDIPLPPTAAPAPSATRTPVPQVISTPRPPLAAAPVVLSGRGQFASQSINLPSTLSVAGFTHNGSSNFVVKVYSGNSGEDLLINQIGSYRGRRPIVGGAPVTLDIEADGAWTVRIDAIGATQTAAFSGSGDNVSGLFDPPARGPWQISHTGQSNFVVQLHCAGGDDLIENEIGAVNGSRVVSFKKGPCFWEVEADGDWILQPRG